MKYIYQHLGLGDHVICNGLIRTVIDERESYSMFVKSHNLTSVKFMYRDLPNLNFIEGDDEFAQSYLRNNFVTMDKLILIGFCQMPLPGARDFDDSFYLQHGVPFEKRWSAFKVERDLESEKKLFDKFNVKEGEYIFIHDDADRNLIIDDSVVQNKELRIIRPLKGLTDNIFDYCYLMEHSAESHFMDSSFRLVFDSLGLRDTKIFLQPTKEKFQINNNSLVLTSAHKLNFVCC